jgi:hypothetical protein
MTEDREIRIAILMLARQVMNAIVERQQAEADLIGRYRDAVHTTAETVEVGGESLAIERDSVALAQRVETAGEFLRVVQRRDDDYEATITKALSRFADVIERR